MRSRERRRHGRRRGLRPLSLLAVAVVAFPGSVRAQGILNAEQYQPKDVSGFHFGLDARGSLVRGNARVLDLGGTGIIGYRAPTQWIRMIVGASYLRTSGSGIVNDRFAHLRYNYDLTPRLRTFHFVQVQANKSLQLSDRELVGSGLRATVLTGKAGSLDVGLGAMLELERLNADARAAGAPARTTDWRMADLAVATVRLGTGASLQDVAYVQPRLDAFSDIRVLDNLNLLVPLTDNVKLTVSGEWRHDSRPPAAVLPDDFSLKTGISILVP